MAYATRADIEAIFGKANVLKWADLDNVNIETDITARIAEALLDAAATVDNRLRDSPYAIPFIAVPQVIKSVTARLAGVWLYESRAVQDAVSDQRPESRLGGHRRRGMQILQDIRFGRIRLDDNLALSSSPFITKVKLT